MKKLVSFILAGLMVGLMISGCQGEDMDQETHELLEDNEFTSLVTQTFNKIGIDIGEENIKIESDMENHGVRSVSVEVMCDDIEMRFSCFYTSETWSPVSISDVETDQYYWITPSAETYEDVYDWKTGEIISEKTDEFPEFTTQKSQQADDSKAVYQDYQSILDDYSERIRDAVPELIEEYKIEAANNTEGLQGLATLSNEKISELAEISNEGISKMAEYYYHAGSGSYDEYEEWAGKLMDVYMEEATKIQDAYMDSAM